MKNVDYGKYKGRNYFFKLSLSVRRIHSHPFDRNIDTKLNSFILNQAKISRMTHALQVLVSVRC